MSTRSRGRTWVAALALVAACGGSGETAADVATEASEESAPDLAVTTALAIRSNPAAADSILAAHGLTRAAFDALMYDVAADATRARAYAEAMR